MTKNKQNIKDWQKGDRLLSRKENMLYDVRYVDNVAPFIDNPKKSSVILKNFNYRGFKEQELIDLGFENVDAQIRENELSILKFIKYLDACQADLILRKANNRQVGEAGNMIAYSQGNEERVLEEIKEKFIEIMGIVK